MAATFESVEDFVSQLPDDRKRVISKLRDCVNKHLPKGFEETISYGMIGWVVPHNRYPKGYHCNPKLPLPYINLGSQKNYVSFYHCGIYAESKLLDWFVTEYPKHCKRKLNMGKGCIRFKYLDDIPYELIGELVSMQSVDDWIQVYEKNTLKK